MESIQDSIQSNQISTDTTIIRVPCIAHVIQLSLQKLLGQIKANPKNETTEINWSEARSQSLRARQQKREIANTLNKVRALAIFINASPQHREAFYNLQTEAPKLVPIQDVRTRWNSTFLMLRRAKKLQPIFDQFCSQNGHDHLMLDQEEWRQIEYLLWITQTFFKFTTALSQTKDVTIHLQRKKVAWKKLMLSALHAAKEKLSIYYGETYKVHGDLFAIGTILAPQNKLQFFSNKDWGPELRDQYRKSFETYAGLYKERLSATQGSPRVSSLGVQTSKIDALFAPDFNQSVSTNETTQYLESETAPIAPRTFWNEHEHKFPALAKMARDVLSIPATGAGVERLFISARDVCHYRRGSLNSTTIQDLMLFMCTARFEVEEKQLSLMKQYLSNEEQQALDEEKDAQQLQDTLEPISDNEEEDGLEISIDQPATQQLSKRAQGERRRSMVSNGEQEGQEPFLSDDEVVLPLPDTQQRISGRNRKRTRREDDQFLHY
ncbi:hypothetical protein IFM58399_09749 [Aspergillus lentulus]|uniref:uncharacterized protein n=1 Tax=Aspergillus lentulus TaxID=293939 RepID=UPI001392B502|nr:uncharacterized protein IFM58399_09749 [Aspergillus lentulus]GFF54131.1 hypothetical protein IFM58399_09749 [Aspergillus lentulus]